MSLKSRAYCFEGVDILRDSCVDSQAGDGEDADGKHPTPTHARAPERWQLLRQDKETNIGLTQKCNLWQWISLFDIWLVKKLHVNL